ncbi:MAG: LON peptidase substrate-binding domain-containing protein [Ardenticatenia bacterium]|nr:LON peptidase substrate-binding domain-containing protein [Ardenticatenia bacterium]
MSSTHAVLPVLSLDTVLFPGMVLAIEVEEAEERQVIDVCLDQDTPFGVVLSRPNPLGLQALPHQVGTAAYVTSYEPLDNTRMWVRAVGSERFMVTHFYRRGDVMTATVVPYPFQEHPSDQVEWLASRLRPAVEAYLDVLADVIGRPLTDEEVPRTPLALACFTAVVLQVDNAVKQALLSVAALSDLLQAELHLLRQELLVLRHVRDVVESGQLPPLVETPLGHISLN